MEEHTSHHHSSNSGNRGMWYLLAVVLLLLFIFGLLSNKKKDSHMAMTETNKEPVAQQKTMTGSYAFDMNGTGGQAADSVFTTGVQKSVSVNMNTEGRQVIGYNLIIQYDPTVMTIGKISSAVPQFTAYQSEATPGYIVIDGVKTTTDNTPVVLSNTSLLNVPVTVKKSGTYNLRLVEKNNKDEAKFFDEAMTPYYPAGGVVTVESK